MPNRPRLARGIARWAPLLVLLLVLGACERTSPDLVALEAASDRLTGLPKEPGDEFPPVPIPSRPQEGEADPSREVYGLDLGPRGDGGPGEPGGILIDPDEWPMLEPKPLIPASEETWVVKYDPEFAPSDIAADAGADLIAVLDHDTLVLGHVPHPGGPVAPGVIAAEVNQPIILAFGQDLTMGFFEGMIFEAGSLEESHALDLLELKTVHTQTQGTGVRIGIADTGIDAKHSYFSGRIVLPGRHEPVGWRESPDGIDNDGDMVVDEAFGHGTFVAGMALQAAPKAKLYPVRALDAEGIGSLADILRALDYLVRQQVDIINLSLSLSQTSPLFDQYLQRIDGLGVAVVVAAGNQGQGTSYPANSPLAMGVAAVDSAGTLARFSNSGPDCELAAPGVDVLSAFPGKHLGYGSGTSFACPVVAGSVALLMEYDGLGPLEAAQKLVVSADPLQGIGDGTINLTEALRID